MKKQQQDKKKAREAKNKKEVQARRVVKQKKDKEANEARKADRKRRKEQKELEKLDQIAEKFYSKLSPEVRAKIEHNIEILKALEEEYEKEQLKKRALNDELESEGHMTLAEKLAAVQAKIAEHMKDQEASEE